jgi:PAS domain S-box-containing protein
MEQNEKILILEDLPTDAALAEREISLALPGCIFRRVENRKEFLDALEEFKPDLIVADYQLPGFDGLTALRLALEKAPDTPFIMHTGSMNEDTAVQCMKEGATDYVIKEHIKRLGPAVTRAMELAEVKRGARLAQKNLIESETRFREFAENASDLIYCYDLYPERRFAYVSPSSTAITGYTPEDHYADPDLGYKMIHPDDKYIMETLPGGNSQPGKPLILRWIRKDGRLIWTEHKIVYLNGVNGKIVAIEGIARDITDRKRAEDDLKNALNKAEESDRFKTAFLNNLSHEIRTPLNAISGFSDMLMESADSREKLKYCTDIIRLSSNQLIRVVEDIITISAIETGQLDIYETEFDLDRLLEKVKDKFRDRAALKKMGIICSLDLNGQDSFILSDMGKLDYIFTHLVDNAIKFSDSGDIIIRGLPEKGFLQFSIADDGIGIDPDMHDKIFKKFQQTTTEISQQRGGLGLGLAVSKSFVESLGGRIWLESSPGSGTVFYFKIPWKQARPDKTEETENATGKPGRKLLVAEDEESNYQLLRELLRDSGINILHAVNGREAIEMVERHQDIDLVIMDIQLPLVDGYEATRNIKEIRPSLPVIALSAHALPGDREKALGAGCDDYLSKPFKGRDLIEMVGKHLA